MSKIVHYRKKCIGCNSCVEHCPHMWKIDTDGKATLIGATKKKNVDVLELDLEFEQENLLAAKDCPVNIIKIEK